MDAVGKTWNPFFKQKAKENNNDSKLIVADRYIEMSFFNNDWFLLYALAEEAVKLLAAKSYYSVSYIVPIYIFYVLFGVMGMLSAQQIEFSEKTIYTLPSSILSVLLNVLLNIILVPKYDAIGAVLSLTVTSLFSSLLHFYYGFKLFNIPLNLKNFSDYILF